MKKIFLLLSFVFFSISLFACANKKGGKMMSLDGVEYDEKFVKSGYYFDKASFSEAKLGEMIEKTELIEKPKNMGEVVLPDLSKIELVNMQKIEITDEIIEATLEEERDRETAYTPVKTKREVMPSDKIVFDCKLFVDGVENENGDLTDQEAVIYNTGELVAIYPDGSRMPFIPGFGEKIIGHKAGSKFSFDITFPEDYKAPELAGKTVEFKDVIIKSIEEAGTPVVDDEFVKAHTTKGSTTVDEYRAEIKQKLEKLYIALNEENLVNQLVEKLMAETKFTPTEEALAWSFSTLLDHDKEYAKQQQSNLATLIVANGISIKDYYDNMKNMAQEYAQSEMLLDTLLKKYNIEVNETKVKEYCDSLKDITSVGYEERLESEGYEQLLYQYKLNKTMTSAMKDCKIVDEVVEE